MPQILCSILTLAIFSTLNVYAKTSYDSLPAVPKAGNFNAVIGMTPITLNPMLSNDLESRDVGGQFFMPLFGTDGETYEPYPALAVKRDISKDKKDYTYTLNELAKFSDGSPVTSDDAEFTFQKLMDPKVEAAALRGYFEGVTFQKIDDHHFRFHVLEPKFNTLTFLDGFVILSKKQFAGETDFNKSKENLRPVGTGPYTIKSFSRDQTVVIERNAKWWAKDLPAFKPRFNQDTLGFKIISDAALKYEKFLNNEIDEIHFTSDQFVNQVRGTDQGRIGTSRSDGKKVWAAKLPTDGPMGWMGIALNQKSQVFKTLNTRKGLAYLIDYKAVISRAFFGMIDQSVSPFGSNTGNTDPALRKAQGIYSFDPKKAASLFEKDGWKREEGNPFYVKDFAGQKIPFQFTLKFPASNPSVSKMVVIMKEGFKKAGVNLDLKPMDITAFYQDFEQSQFDAAVMGWGGGSIDPDAKQLWSSESQGAGSNKVGFANPQADELIKRSNLEFDRKKRAKLLQQISKIIYDEVPYIFLVERHFVMQGLNSKFKSPKWIERYGDSAARELFFE